MKNQKKQTRKNFPLTAILFILALVVVTFSRYTQYTTVIQIEDGFFEFDGGFLNHSYYVCLALFAVAVTALYFFDKSKGRGILSAAKKTSPAAKGLSEIMAIVGSAITAACGFLIAVDTIGLKTKSAVIIAVFILASAGYTYCAYVTFTKKQLTPSVAIAFLFTSAFSISQASSEYMQRVNTANLTASLAILISYIFLSVFFLSGGRILVQRETRFTAATATLFGYLSALVIFSDATARLLCYYTTDAETQELLLSNPNGFTLPRILFILQGAAALWVVYALSAPGNKVAETSEAAESEKVEKIEKVENNKENEIKTETEKNADGDNNGDSADSADS